MRFNGEWLQCDDVIAMIGGQHYYTIAQKSPNQRSAAGSVP